MAVLGNIPKVDAKGDFSARFVLASRLLELGAHADAYLLFERLLREQEFHIPTLYNLALCHVAAGEWEPCLKLLERAVAQLRKQSVDPSPRDATWKALFQRQSAGRSYLFPLTEQADELAPEYTRECVLRLIVDGCVACRQWEQLRIAAGQLQSRDYLNVRKALEQAGDKGL